MKPSIAITMHPDHHPEIPHVLRTVAAEFLDAMWTSARRPRTLDLMRDTAHQLSTIAVMVEQGQADAETGLLFIGAGRRLLDRLQSSTDSTETAKPSVPARMPKPSDTPAAKRAYARERGQR